MTLRSAWSRAVRRRCDGVFGCRESAAGGVPARARRAPRPRHQRDRDGCGADRAAARPHAAPPARSPSRAAASAPAGAPFRPTHRGGPGRFGNAVAHGGDHHRDRANPARPPWAALPPERHRRGRDLQHLTISQGGSGYTLSATSSGLSRRRALPSRSPLTGELPARDARRDGGQSARRRASPAGRRGEGSVASGLDGTFSLTGLAPGSYSVRVATAGYRADTDRDHRRDRRHPAVNFSLSRSSTDASASRPRPTVA